MFFRLDKCPFQPKQANPGAKHEVSEDRSKKRKREEAKVQMCPCWKQNPKRFFFALVFFFNSIKNSLLTFLFQVSKIFRTNY